MAALALSGCDSGQTAEPVGEPDLGPIEASDSEPAPEVDSPEDLPKFFEWFLAIRPAQYQEAVFAIHDFATSSDYVDAAVLLYEDYRNSGVEFGVFDLIRHMPPVEAESALHEIAMDPVDGEPPEPPTGAFDQFTYDSLVRRDAVASLLDRGTESSYELALDVCLNHEEQLVRVASLENYLPRLDNERKRILLSEVRGKDRELIHPDLLPSD